MTIKSMNRMGEVKVPEQRLSSSPAVGIVLLMLLIAGSAMGGENWTSYRGPTDQGHSDAANLPLHWSETENVVWKTPIPGKAWSSPVIWGDRIWLSTATEDGTELSVLAVDKNSGKILVEKRLRHVAKPQYCIPFNSYASPSPVIEEGRVYVSFGSPYIACLDSTTGDVIWQRTDFVCNHYRAAGSSPFLYEDLLVLPFDGADRQYVAALDKRTGKTVWNTPRSFDFQDSDAPLGTPIREGDLHKAFSTPVIADAAGRPVLVSLGSMALYGYEPKTGRELWRVESRGSHSGSARPVVGQGLVFTPIGYTAAIWAVRPDGRGEVTASHVVWKYPSSTAKRSSPLLVGDELYLADDGGVAVCLDAKTGRGRWKARLGGNYSASPIDACGRIYFFDERGKSTVIEAGPRYKMLAENRLKDGFMASPAVSGNALYLRTKKALYRIEEKH
ncbi:MAG: PQQ-binding-like beta-propeller repeat protein [Thermoguttaceae bacterium]